MLISESPGVPAIQSQVLHAPARGAADVTIGILAKKVAEPDRRLPPLLLVHGATFGASLFDLPSEDYSLMSRLARDGRAVYALDVRGFGHSLGGVVMDALPSANAPFARLEEAVADIGTAVDLIRSREQVAAVDLVGFSWGTVTAASYAGGHAETVSRLVLYAPLYGEENPAWLDQIADPADRSRARPGLGAYRLVTQADIIRRWDSDLPASDAEIYREPGLPELIFRTLADLDPQAMRNDPPAFRCPTGALADLVEVFNGRPLFDASRLTMPTYLVRGSDDTTSTDSDARNLLSAVSSPQRDYRIVSPGSHFLCLERERRRLWDYLSHVLSPAN
jgi:pimeloyl-ACP methyl ester carboxylesterase